MAAMCFSIALLLSTLFRGVAASSWPRDYAHYYWMDASYGTAEIRGDAQSGMSPRVPTNVYGIVTGGNLNIPGVAEEMLVVVQKHKKAKGQTAQIPASITDLKFIYIGAACADDESCMEAQFQPFTDNGFQIQIDVNVFWPKMKDYSNRSTIAKMFEQVDVLLFGWGDTLFGLDAMSRKARSWDLAPWSLMKHIRHLHHSSSLPAIFGGSAGLDVWFDSGHSDSCNLGSNNWPLTRVPGLGLLPGFVCPHFDIEADSTTTAQTTIGKDQEGHLYRGYDFALHLTKDTGDELGLAVDNDAALVLTGEDYSVFPVPPWRPWWAPTLPPNVYNIDKETARGIFDWHGQISPKSLTKWWRRVRWERSVPTHGKLWEILRPGGFWADPDLLSQCHSPQNLPSSGQESMYV